VRGDVLVTLTTNRDDRLLAGAVFASEAGELEVVASRPHQHRYIVTFDGVDRDRAEELRGVVLLAEAIDDPDALWVHDLIGAEVVDVDGVARGTVEAVEANPASDLLVLDSGALVPLRFVVERREGRLTIDPPRGLFEV
jgi:16S rRNA processing protein RimM